MKTQIFIISLLIIKLFSIDSYAQSSAVERGAYTMPYTRYEGEKGISNTIEKHQSHFFNIEEKASEASNQQFVTLSEVGASIEWIALSDGDGITLRFSMKDSEVGGGVNGTLALYIEDEFIKNIGLTSYWAWQYYPYSDGNNNPINTPSDRPRMRFDELHFRLNEPILEGQTIKIVKETSDDIEYGIDFLELEDTGDLVEKPEGYFDITSYGAVANDGQDDINAFYSALYQAKLAGTGVYIPEGTFNLSDKIELTYDNIGFIGAGLWRTELFFTEEGQFKGGLMCNASNIEIGHFYMNTVNDQRFIDGEYVNHKGISGTFGTNSNIHDVWITHFETGAWIGDYSSTPKITTNLTFTRNRIRNNYADGINLTQGTSSTIVSHCDFRSNSDDGIAIWPNNFNGAKETINNEIHNNTVEFNIRASGIAIFGGQGHSVHHNIVKDGFAGSGLRITTDFDGFHFENNTEMNIYENTFLRCGTSSDLWNNHRGAIEINASKFEIKNINFDNIDIIDAQRHAIQIGGSKNIKINFSNIAIDGTGKDNKVKSIYTSEMGGAAIVSSASLGTATFTNVIYNEIETTPYYFNSNANFNLSLQNEKNKFVKGDEYLIDFGPNDGVNGDDTNLTIWNNINVSNASETAYSITSKEGTGEEITIKLTSDFYKNGKQHGGLYYPNAVIGDFNISSATIDYFFTSSTSTLEIEGLDPLTPYQFSIFGSRDASSTRISKYSFQGNELNHYFSKTSGEGIGGTGYNGNQYNTLNTDYLFPNAEGKIVLAVHASEGGYGYLNCLKITSLTDGFEKLNSAPVVEEIENKMLSAGTESVVLSAIATDIDADELTYQWEIIQGEEVEILTATESETTIQGLKNGSNYIFKVTVSDAYESVFKEVEVTVENTMSQTISGFELPETILITSEDIVLDALASSNLPVVYSSSDEEIITVENNILKIVKSGSVSITASQEGNGAYLPAENIVLQINIVKVDQEITFTTAQTIEVKTGSFDLEGFSSSSLPITYISSDENILSISENTATLHGAGTVSITASQSGNAIYNNATSIEQVIEVVKTEQTIDFSVEAAVNIESNYILLEGTASSGLPIVYSSSDDSILTINEDTAFLHSMGEVIITASQEGDNHYYLSENVIQTIEIGTSKKEQLITFSLANEMSVISEPITLNAESTSELEITYFSSDESIATIIDGKLIPNTVGKVEITALQEGNENYLSATPITATITIIKAEQNVDFLLQETIELKEEYILLAATSDTDLPMTYLSSDEAIISISEDTAYLHSVGKVIITVIQEGNEIYLPATEVSQSIQLVKSEQEINFTLINKAARIDEFMLLNATSSAGLPITYSSSDETILSISNDTAFFQSAGEVEITASQEGNLFYEAGTLINRSILIEKSEQTISFELPSDLLATSNYFLLDAESDKELPIEYHSNNEAIITIADDTAFIHSAGAVEITALQVGNEYYKEQLEVKEITILKSTQEIVFSIQQQRKVGDKQFYLSGSSSADLPLTYSSSNEAIISISGDTAYIHQEGVAIITASQLGNDQYSMALAVTLEVEVTKETQSITFDLIETISILQDSLLLEGYSISGLPISYASSNTNIIEIEGDVARLLGAGTVTITAIANGNEYFTASNTIEKSITIYKEAQTVPEIILSDTLYIENNTYRLPMYTKEGLPLSYSSSDTSILTVEDSIINLHSVGDIFLTINQVGNQWYQAIIEEVHHLVVRNQVTEQENVTALKVQDQKIKVYPNPSKGIFKVDQNADLVYVYAFDGRLMKTIEGQQTHYNLSTLPSGTYFIMLRINNSWHRVKWLKN